MRFLKKNKFITYSNKCEHCLEAFKKLEELEWKQNKEAYRSTYYKGKLKGKRPWFAVVMPDYNAWGNITHFHLEVYENTDYKVEGDK